MTTPALTLTNRRKRVVFEAVQHSDGTFSYHAEGSGGMSLTQRSIISRALMHLEWHPSAIASGPLVHEFRCMLKALTPAKETT